MKYLSLVVLSFFLVTAPCYAQTLEPNSYKSLFEAPDSLRAEYTEIKYIPSLTKPLKSEGVFVYMKDKGLLWNMNAPFNMQTLITPQGLHQWVDGEKQPQSEGTHIALRPILNNISNIFSGDMDTLADHFDITEKSSEKEWSLTLIPISDHIKPYLQDIKVRGARHIHDVTITYGKDKYTYVTYSMPQIGLNHITDKERGFFE